MIDEAICSRALSFAPLVDLISDRLWAVRLPDNYSVTDPAVVYQIISDVPDTAINGPILQRDARYQFSVYGQSRPDVFATADQLIACFHGWSSPPVKRMSFLGRNEIFESDSGLVHVPVDFSVKF